MGDRFSRTFVFLLAGLLCAEPLLRAEGDSVAPDDLPALKAHVGQTVEIKGTVASVGESKTGGILYVNFDKKPHTAVTVVFFTTGTRAGSVKSKDELQPFVGKTVTVKGELSEYKEDVQIVLQSTDDIHAD